MRRHELGDNPWKVVVGVLPRGLGRPSARGDRNFVNAVVWIAKTGAPWRDLPERFGNWKTIFNRFAEWSKRGVWAAIFKALAFSDDEVGSLVDGSIVRAHQDLCGGNGGPKKTPLGAHSPASPHKSTPSATLNVDYSTPPQHPV